VVYSFITQTIAYSLSDMAHTKHPIRRPFRTIIQTSHLPHLRQTHAVGKWLTR
jgi:hypothetical protein